jgi:protease secretion system outer membrane protein
MARRLSPFALGAAPGAGSAGQPRRRSIRASLLVSAMLIGSAAPVAAQTLTLQQVYTAALGEDATLRASRAQADVGREALPQAEARLLPNVSMNFARSKEELDSTSLGARELTSHSRYLAGSRVLSIRQPILHVSDMANLRQARARVDETEANLEKDTQNLAVRVCEAYFELLLADEQTALVVAQRTAYTTQLAAAERGFAAGSGTRTDADEVRARLDLNAADELQARQHRLVALRQLRTMVTAPFDAVAPLDAEAFLPTAPAPVELDGWTARAEMNSPEIKALQAQLEAARQEVAKAKGQHMPTIDLVASASRNESDSIDRIGSRYSSKSIGVQLNVPLFAGGAVNSAVRQALADQARIDASLEALRRDLNVRVYREFSSVTEGALRIRALQQAVRSSEQVVLSNRKSFAAGSRTTVDVLNAEQQRVSAQRDLAQARYLYLISGVRLVVLGGAFDGGRLQHINQFFTLALAAQSGPTPRATGPGGL